MTKQSNSRQIVSSRHAIIHERARQQLAGCRIVDAALAQRLTYPLNDSAVQLALNDHGIYDSADIIDGGVVDELHDAGLGVDLYFGDVSAAGKAKVDWIVVGLFLQPRLERLEWIVVRHVGITSLVPCS